MTKVTLASDGSDNEVIPRATSLLMYVHTRGSRERGDGLSSDASRITVYPSCYFVWPLTFVKSTFVNVKAHRKYIYIIVNTTQFNSVQLLDWVVRWTSGTIQKRSSSSLLCGRPS